MVLMDTWIELATPNGTAAQFVEVTALIHQYVAR
jgi:hypothetical protein